ncbi:unnamed protein product [Rotaria sp. Silwood1]|nr:unnamed protein product [Rotaria sp. Silwood1]
MTFSSILFPLILNSSSLTSSIKFIHVDDDNSISCDLIYKDIFYQDNKPLIEILYELSQYQLNELTLTITEDLKYNSDYSQLPQ